MNPTWSPVDYKIDIYTPRKVPESPYWSALDFFFFIQFCIVVFIGVIIDSKMLQSGLRSELDIRRRWRENTLPRNLTFEAAYTRELYHIALELLQVA